jgi:hypothetical protein
MSNPKKPSDVGTNRTGISTSPTESEKSLEGARAGSPPPEVEPVALEASRLEYSRRADPVGTMPPPASLKGAVKAATKRLQGKHPMVFLDLLGERLAFERTGTRLYEALLVKCRAADPRRDGPNRADLERIRDDELAHFALLARALETLGADPTAMTPSAGHCGGQRHGMGASGYGSPYDVDGGAQGHTGGGAHG